jgi:hypothetical protein
MINVIEIKKEDVYPLILFIIAMYQQEKVHRQGTSSKEDSLGGFIDRWINKLPETILFNQMILKDAEFEVISDFFLYSSSTEKNAPDVLGIRSKKKLIKFVEYCNKGWERIDGMPFIEVKTFKKNQVLVSVRETQLNDNDYYVFAESNFRSDYLLDFFDSSFFDKKPVKELMMDSTFIKSDDFRNISQYQPIVRTQDEALGTLRLIAVIKGSDLKNHSLKCSKGENAHYFGKIEQRTKVVQKKIEMTFDNFFKKMDAQNMYEGTWEGVNLIPIKCIDAQNIIVLKANKKSLVILATDEAFIYDFKLEKDKIYSIEIKVFERSSSWTEYVALKNLFDSKDDRTENLKDELHQLYKSSPSK